MRAERGLLLAVLVVGLAGLAACTTIVPGDGDPAEPAADALPEFAVADANPASARFGENVSPRDYLGEVSAWYFGHAT